MVDGNKYELSCHPYEPCTYIKGESCFVAIHNAFDPEVVLKCFSRKEPVDTITGNIYDPESFCQLLAFALKHFSDTDISYLEGSIAVAKMEELGITSPERAVYCKDLGIRKISDAFSHSKKLTKRVMYTTDGRVYLRIKE